MQSKKIYTHLRERKKINGDEHSKEIIKVEKVCGGVGGEWGDRRSGLERTNKVPSSGAANRTVI